jgi:hypothetical protein
MGQLAPLGRTVLIYSTAAPEQVASNQNKLGREQAGELVEQTLGRIARGLVDAGVRRLVVAGGETAGAVVSALGVQGLHIGPEIDPGVPWTSASASRRSRSRSSRAISAHRFLSPERSGFSRDRSKLREEICYFGRSLFDRGLTFGSAATSARA